MGSWIRAEERFRGLCGYCWGAGIVAIQNINAIFTYGSAPERRLSTVDISIWSIDGQSKMGVWKMLG